jgi:xylose isomerase
VTTRYARPADRTREIYPRRKTMDARMRRSSIYLFSLWLELTTAMQTTADRVKVTKKMATDVMSLLSL